MPSGTWDYPRRHSALQRQRTSEAQRQRHGRLDPLVLVHMQPIPGARYVTCRWIVQIGRPPLFCVALVCALGCSWCVDHARIVFAQRDDADG